MDKVIEADCRAVLAMMRVIAHARAAQLPITAARYARRRSAPAEHERQRRIGVAVVRAVDAVVLSALDHELRGPPGLV